MEFIAIAGHQQPPAGVDFPGDRNQAHAAILDPRAIGCQ
jgi:hypothetical protein